MSISTTQKPTTRRIVGMVVGIVIIGLGIALFKDLFSLIVGADFREGIFILPVVLGMLCTMLMYNENQYDMLKQLWIVPVNKMAYFFSKFAVVLVYSVCFMLITAAASILTGVLPGYIAFDSGSVLYLLRKCMEISLLTAFAMLLCVIGAGIYLTMTMLFRINSIQVQTPDGKQVTEIAGYSADSILQRMGVQLEENIFSFEPGEKAAVLEQNFPLLGSIKVIRDYPNTVVVQVTEAVPAYAVQNGNKWLVISDKWKILSEESTQPEGLCTLYGGKLQDTTPGQGFWFVDDADAASASGSESAESESTVSTETARMEALRTLRSKLEEYGLSQDVTRLEVADTEQLAFLYQDRISVLLGTLNDLDYKLDRARYVLTNADGKGCGPTDTGRLDFSHTSASSTRKIYFAQGEPALPSGYVVPPKAEEPAPAEDAADSTDSAESTDTADTTEPAADADTEQLPLTHPDRMTANEEENPM